MSQIKTIKLNNSNDYFDLYDLTGYEQGQSLIILNNTTGQIRLHQAAVSPTDNISGFPLWPNKTALVHGNNQLPLWVKGSDKGQIIVQPLTSTILPFTGVELPQDIVTSGVQGFRRLQVDQGQTSFFEGREFRIIRKIRLPQGERRVYKFVCDNPFILSELKFTVSQGNFEVHVYDSDNVNETVASTTPVPFYRKNESDEYRDYGGSKYTSLTTITTGGSISAIDPDSYRDYAELITSGATAQRVTASIGTGSERYNNAGTFYLEIFAINGPVRGTISASWEERPPGVK
jgi:hypothetical protein